MADELSGPGPDANDVGSDTGKTALWLATAPTRSPHPGRPSQNLPAGLFSVLRAENTWSQVVVRPQGCWRKEELSDPPRAHANHNKPQPRPRAAIQPPLPGHRALAQSPKPREPCPEKRPLTSAKELSGKFHYLSWQKRKKESYASENKLPLFGRRQGLQGKRRD